MFSGPHFKKPLLLCLATVCSLLLMPPPLQSQIIANFDDGNTNTEVDGYLGTAGNGWSTAWSTSSNSNATVDGDVIDTNPFPGGGNYLSLNVENSGVGTGTQAGGVRRTYESFGGVDTSAVHTVSFNFRLDGGIDDLNRVRIMNSSTLNPNASNWKIRTLGTGSSNFAFEEGGSSNVNTNVQLVEGNEYYFELTLDPVNNRYIGHVSNLTTGTDSFTSDWMDFQPNTFSSTLHFLVRVTDRASELDPNTEVNFSIDSIHIIPEPGTGLLALLGILALLGRRRVK